MSYIDAKGRPNLSGLGYICLDGMAILSWDRASHGNTQPSSSTLTAASPTTMTGRAICPNTSSPPTRLGHPCLTSTTSRNPDAPTSYATVSCPDQPTSPLPG